jgi:ABC-type ATPase involved in cell division
MPPASFGMLLTTLAGEAMVNLGQVPHPLSGQVEINLAVARYFIDTLQILQEKTEGNLSPEESQAVTSVLHELQLAYLSAESHVAATLAEAAAPPPTGE